MGTRFDFTATVDATPEQVWNCLADPEFWQARFSVVGSPTDEVVSHHVTEDTIEVELSQTVADEHIPAAAKKIVGGNMAITRYVLYKRAGNAISGESHGGGVGGLLEVSGEITIAQDGKSVIETAHGVATVSVPLIGGKLEKSVISYLQGAQRDELAYVPTYLDR